MKIFVCEYITGGGLYRAPLTSSLAQEGDLMLQALLADLAAIPTCAIHTTRDARLLPLAGAFTSYPVSADCGNIWALWEDCIRVADAVWPIAPESDGVLERLSRLAISHGKCLFGSAPQAVRLAASKRATAAALAAHSVPVLPTYQGCALPRDYAGPWVAKPDDGAGCEDTRWFADTLALLAWLRQDAKRASYAIQPYCPGIPASLSLLCRGGQAWLLSANRQDVRLRDGVFTFHGCVLNDLATHTGEFSLLAQAVAAAIPGLAGYIGIDVIVGDHGITVLEVNPRLTTSYAGLNRAIGVNPAKLILDLLYFDCFSSLPALTRQVVPIIIHE